ncbi:uncharacterized protein TrAFT101_002331 [Trichoderma asperellum]|uniref:Uncharacterized protein n=1 Tax=Trichoderma asperellum (strain ATCC 204424 / CBS 433.97 / NBRC 101777) TaxID=1042311 RepID=A0A2T3YRI4_TRIA4|nr:hypothetical protein M441DRAFT_62997 [Trichoderma asperellum CBS 433.97]PTB35137.1 hypothetical protein M441DRAFT_62997 [Trichoderma asperellum CBS 433.97]UKZ86505.1 hypothetical protein TrAFT101_002331 [Trichoderma asperellum]
MMREDILSLFDSLSSQADTVKQKMKLYNHDPDLQIKFPKLYMTLCKCIIHSTKWLDEKSSVQSFKTFFQQSRYGNGEDDARKNMMKKNSKVRRGDKIDEIASNDIQSHFFLSQKEEWNS